jgi:hypothetical protein
LSETSQGIGLGGSVFDVEGKKWFFVDDKLKVTHMVVTRTFNLWEKRRQKQTFSTAASSEHQTLC